MAAVFLVLASVVFYGTWNIAFVPLLAGSVSVNYAAGRHLQHNASKLVLWLSIALNLTVLGYFKYANFFVSNAAALTGHDWSASKVALPIGISFYTFQQIAWLADSYLNKRPVHKGGFWRYALFVTFFPQLLAGPIVRYEETPPQFSRHITYSFQWDSLAIGMSIFIIGLSKKLFVADELNLIATPPFVEATSSPVAFVNAWTAVFCYAFQIYFDFSGYSDMAIGIARMFNIRLPMNFNSPFKAAAIIDFWKAWHMTMTRFFQSYVYTPLSIILFRVQTRYGVRGNLFMYVSTLITLLAIGFWHGANWTFLVFGLLHGCAIVINHIWRALSKKGSVPHIPHYLGVFLTFFFFMLTCVIYRSENMAAAMNMYHSMFSPVEFIGEKIKINTFIFVVGVACACLFLPNTQQIFHRYLPVADLRNMLKFPSRSVFRRLAWRPNVLWGTLLLALYIISLDRLMDANKVTEIIYFKF